MRLPVESTFAIHIDAGSYCEAILPRIRSAHQHTCPWIDQNPLKAAEAAGTVRNNRMSARGERLADRFRNRALELQAVLAMVHACGFTGFLNVHAEVDEV